MRCALLLGVLMSSFTFAFLLVAQSGEGTRSDWADDMARVVQALRERGATTEDPWLLSHACLALGDSFALPSGTEAVDHLIATFGVHEATTGERGWGFPPPVDPHTCSFISELARGPIDFDVVVEPIQAMRRCFLQACFLAVQWEDLRPEVERVWPLAVAVAVAGTEWVPPPPRMDAYVSAAIEAYERRSRSYHAAYAENRDRHPLSFQHIPCNGRHLLFAFVCAAFAGEPDRERQATVVRLLGKERDRLASELTRVAHSADKPAFLHHAESIGRPGHPREWR